ncbi:MAG: hypothetical protein R3D02_10730 [Hyphomicrobiales bacterium]
MSRSNPATLTERFARIALVVSASAVLFFLIAPILAILPLSVNDSEFLTYPFRGFTWRWYEAVFSSDKWRTAVMNSFLIGIPATIIAVLGTLAPLALPPPTSAARRPSPPSSCRRSSCRSSSSPSAFISSSPRSA